MTARKTIKLVHRDCGTHYEVEHADIDNGGIACVVCGGKPRRLADWRVHGTGESPNA